MNSPEFESLTNNNIANDHNNLADTFQAEAATSEEQVNKTTESEETIKSTEFKENITDPNLIKRLGTTAFNAMKKARGAFEGVVQKAGETFENVMQKAKETIFQIKQNSHSHSSFREFMRSFSIGSDNYPVNPNVGHNNDNNSNEVRTGYDIEDILLEIGVN